MEIGTLLAIVAGILAILDLALGRAWTPERYHRARWLSVVAVILLCFALLLGVNPLIRT